MNIVLEAIIVGILNTLFGGIISYILMGEKAKAFNDCKRVLGEFFITGFIIHIFCEYTGLNSKYSKNKKSIKNYRRKKCNLNYFF